MVKALCPLNIQMVSKTGKAAKATQQLEAYLTTISHLAKTRTPLIIDASIAIKFFKITFYRKKSRLFYRNKSRLK